MAVLKRKNNNTSKQFLNGFIFGINIPESNTVTNACVKKKKKIIKVFTLFYAQSWIRVYIAYNTARVGRWFLLLYKVQKLVKVLKIIIITLTTRLKQDPSYSWMLQWKMWLLLETKQE